MNFFGINFEVPKVFENFLLYNYFKKLQHFNNTHFSSSEKLNRFKKNLFSPKAIFLMGFYKNLINHVYIINIFLNIYF